MGNDDRKSEGHQDDNVDYCYDTSTLTSLSSSFDCYSSDDDDMSLSSSYSSTSSSSASVVSFQENLVTDVWTRPRTTQEDISNLFYNSEDYQRFRHENRLERKQQRRRQYN